MAIMGDGPLRTSLASLCRQLGLEECVSFLGKLPRWTVIERLKGAAATLVPSVPWQGDEEATSIAALESMAVGTPVVASRSGGLAEIIEDGTTGVLVEPGNPRAIAAGVRGLLTDPTRWRRIALRAREYIEKEHDWARAVTVLEQIYWQVTPT
jgi:glycosyltransferase involved in cell wall biosynthesis